MKKVRKYHKFEDYVENVVKKCSHGYLILDHKDFRKYRFETQVNKNAKLPTGKLIKIVPARCKSYSCPICGKKKVLDLLDLLKGVNLSKYRFFTLTLKNAYSSDNTEQNLKRISECFNKLNKKLRKKAEFKNLEYFRVIEIGKNGNVHIHGIWNKYIDQVYLSKLWLSITKDSYRTKVERIKSKNDAVSYLYKYLTKLSVLKDDKDFIDERLFEKDFFDGNSEKLFYENGKRRWAVSRNFFNKELKKKIKERNNNYVPYYYEAETVETVEITVKAIRERYGLKLEHFDFSRYYESDQFLINLFKDEIKNKLIKPPQ